MTRPIVEVVIRAGLVPHDSLVELRRWGLPVSEIVEGDLHLKDAADAESLIVRALESVEQVQERLTDPNILPLWLNEENRVKGTLHLTDTELGTKTTVRIDVVRTKLGEYLMPWRAENIVDLLMNGECFLKVDGEKIYFGDVREIYFGDIKTFLIGIPRKKAVS